MNFVDRVKNPLDNDEFLKQLIILYADQDKETRASGSYIYDALIKHPESEANENKKEYWDKFEKFVRSDTICKLLTDVLKYSPEEARRIYDDLYNGDKQSSELLPMDTYDLIDELEEKDCLVKAYGSEYYGLNTSEILEAVFSGHGTMGYHIYESKFGNKFAFEGDTVKLYINAGSDIYELSKIFKEKCEQMGLGYMYKVVNPIKSEHTRADKMCIYSSLDDIESYIEIVTEIRREHPDFDYRLPVPIMGSIDEWIGIGADPDNFEKAASYSDSRALLLENSLSSILGNASKKKIMKKLEKNPDELLERLRAEVKRRSKGYLITKHFAFDDIIVKALKINDRNYRESYYMDNRMKLFTDVLKTDKLSILGRIKKILPKKRKVKSDCPDFQLTIPDEPKDEFVKRIHIDLSKIDDNGVPSNQTPISTDSHDKDDSDIWR